MSLVSERKSLKEDKMNIFFTSDTHFGHKNIIKYCNRPFNDVNEMNEILISRWNSKVNPDDLVYHLGDFSMRAVPEIRKRLNGDICLIRGNHDVDENFGFKSIKDYDEVIVHNQKIILFHYGLRTWHHDIRGVWHLYGHSHGLLPAYGKSLDIGVDSWHFYPVGFYDLKNKMGGMDIGKHPMWDNYVPKENA